MKKFLTIIFGVLFSIPAMSATLPSGYTELEYVNMPAGSYLLTDIVPTYDGRVEMDFQTTSVPTGSVYLLGGRTETYGGLFFVKTSAGVFMVDAFGNKSADRYTSSVTAQNNTRYKFTFNNKVATLESGGTTLFTNTSTGTLANGAALVINGLNSDGTISGGQAGIYLYSFKVWNTQGELVAGYVPAKNSSGVIGMYNVLDSNPATAFHTNAGTGTFTAGPVVVTNSGPISSVTVSGLVAQNGTPTPNTPVAINTNNGVLKYSKNLLDMAPENIVLGKYINNSGVITDNTANFYNSKFIPVSPSSIYSWSTSESVRYINFMEYDSDQVFLRRTLIGSSETSAGTSGNLTTGSDTAFVLIGSNMDTTNVTLDKIAAVDWQFEKGSSATTYHPYGEIYTDGTVETIEDSANHTATVATLLGVGDYRDTQNINTGAITRKVGVKVLDGTEDWVKTTSYANAFRVDNFINSASSFVNLSTHFTPSSASTVGDAGTVTTAPNNGRLILGVSTSLATTAEQFKQYLADQYAAGTPVIVIYPLATATTESVAGQTMTMAPVSNATGGVNGMTITTLLSGGREIVTNIVATGIKIATRAYNTTQFAPVVSALNTAVNTIKDVVTNTINQTAAVSALQSTKQTRPNDACPQYKQCLLVETEDGTPQWFVITDPFRDLFSPVIANNIAATGTTSQNAYTQLQYIYMTEGSYLMTDIVPSSDMRIEMDFQTTSIATKSDYYLGVRDVYGGVEGLSIVKRAMSNGGTLMFDGFEADNRYTSTYVPTSNTRYKYTYDNGTITLTKDNAVVVSHTFTPDSTVTSKLTINGFNDNGSVLPGLTGIYLYSFKVWNAQGELVMNLVPAIQGTTIGFFDTVTGDLRGPSAGTFTAGPTVSNQNATWTATFGANDTYGYGRSIVYGTAKCNATSGSANDVATAAQIAAANWTATGSNCWCYAERVNETSSGVSGTSANRWVYLAVPSGETCAANCVENCANAMASGAAADKPFRQALVGL